MLTDTYYIRSLGDTLFYYDMKMWLGKCEWNFGQVSIQDKPENCRIAVEEICKSLFI